MTLSRTLTHVRTTLVRSRQRVALSKVRSIPGITVVALALQLGVTYRIARKYIDMLTAEGVVRTRLDDRNTLRCYPTKVRTRIPPNWRRVLRCMGQDLSVEAWARRTGCSRTAVRSYLKGGLDAR